MHRWPICKKKISRKKEKLLSNKRAGIKMHVKKGNFSRARKNAVSLHGSLRVAV